MRPLPPQVEPVDRVSRSAAGSPRRHRADYDPIVPAIIGKGPRILDERDMTPGAAVHAA